MAGNTQPIFSKVGAQSWVTLTTASTASDGTGATVLFTADGTNGGRVDTVLLAPLGTNVATVVRVFINNGSTVGTAANNSLIAEVAMAATTVSQTTAQTISTLALGIPLAPGYRLTCAIGTAVAAGIAVTALSGAY